MGNDFTNTVTETEALKEPPFLYLQNLFTPAWFTPANT